MFSGDLVTLDEAAYDVCAALAEDGESALAGLLAHELIHYYEKHTWESGFVRLIGQDDRQAAAPLGRAVKEDAYAITKDEIEADYQGGFLAHLAGYPTTTVMPRVLEGIYAAYNLPAEVPQYPPLRERQRIAEETHARLLRLIDVFDTGNLLTALRRYDEAVYYYDYLAERFPSREILNNTGVAYVQAAIPLFKPTTLTYVYPVELDLDSRLAAQTRSVGVQRQQREYLLKTALTYFQRAAILDPAYSTALVNRASAHALLAASMAEAPAGTDAEVVEDERIAAGLYARRALRMATEQSEEITTANAHLVLAILAAEAGNDQAAATGFEKAGASPLYAINEAVRATGSLPEPPSRPREFAAEEAIAGKTINELAGNLPEWTRTTVVSRSQPQLRLSTAENPETSVRVRYHEVRQSDDDLLFVSTTSGYSESTTLDVRLGSQTEEILDEYDEPDYRVPVAGGVLLVYRESGLLFHLKGDTLISWTIFGE